LFFSIGEVSRIDSTSSPAHCFSGPFDGNAEYLDAIVAIFPSVADMS
jgi:hypothetical protein